MENKELLEKLYDYIANNIGWKDEALHSEIFKALDKNNSFNNHGSF